MGSARPTLQVRILRGLVRLLPAEFRGDFGAAIEADLAEGSHERRPGLLRHELPGLARAIVREHAAVLAQNLRHSLRLMQAAPGFTALAVLMLALGTGANVAVFSVIDAVMLRSPFPNRDQLAIVQVMDGTKRFSSVVPMDRYRAMAAAGEPFAAIAGLDGGAHALTHAGQSRRLDVECVTASMFDVLGTAPIAGRVFSAGDDRPGGAPVAVISHALWTELGQPSSIIGSAITLNQTPVTVLGVMPRGFAGAFSRNDVRAWLPLSISVKGGGLGGCQMGDDVNAFARVAPGHTLASAGAALTGVQLTSLDEQTFFELRSSFFTLAAAVVCVLLITCANVGSLQLERTLARSGEMALRLSLGASRGRLMRQMCTESLLLALAGAAGGVLATQATLEALVSLLPSNLPHLDEIAVNGRVLAAALAAATIAGLVAGIIPLTQVRGIDPVRDLQAFGRAVRGQMHWSRRALVVAEVALSVVVLVAAVLMLQTFWTLRPSQPGFDPDGKLTTLVRVPEMAPAEAERLFATLFDRLRVLPDVRGISGSTYLPMSGSVASVGVSLDDKTVVAYGASITPAFLPMLRVPIRTGRTFAESDTAGAAPVAIVNETLASRLRANGSVLGAIVRAQNPRTRGGPAIDRQVVGIIGNMRSYAGNTRSDPEFYVPFAQNPVSLLNVVVEVDRRAAARVAGDMRQALTALQPSLAIEPIDALRDRVDRRVARPRFGAWLLGIFAALAVTLAAVGLMTTIGWWVRQRTREIGVRVALGATRARLLRLVLRQGMGLAALGIVVGLGAAAAVTRYMEGMIYGIAPRDTPTFIVATALMLVVAAIAIYAPVRRALKVDPVVALRAD